MFKLWDDDSFSPFGAEMGEDELLRLIDEYDKEFPIPLSELDEVEYGELQELLGYADEGDFEDD
jgi:uncharacterized protein YfeS